jgi:nucleoside-diphosphate-sugar epimerase
MANVLITGGVGFLGSRLARELLTVGSLEVAGSGARRPGGPARPGPGPGLRLRHQDAHRWGPAVMRR